MATFDADHLRAVALEMKEKAFDLYTDILPLITAVSAWVLNSLDTALPSPFNVKVQLDAYQALTIDRLKLTDWISALQAALPGDTLTYPPPPILSGQISFETLCFDTLTF